MTYHRKPEAIEDEIEMTRRRIESRLESLSDDISPAGIFEKVVGGVGGNGNSSDMLDTAIHRAKENPFSALLIGAGLAGLVLSNRNGNSRAEVPNDDYTYPSTTSSDPADRLARNAEKLKAQAENAKDNLADGASRLAKDMRHEAEGLKNTVQQTASNVAETISETASSAAETASRAYSRTERAARETRDRTAYELNRAPVRARAGAEDAVEWVKENPVPAGLLALAVGATVASIFTSKKSDSRLAASRSLHEEARNEDEDEIVAAPVMTARARNAAKSPKRKSASNASSARRSPKPKAKPKMPAKGGPVTKKVKVTEDPSAPRARSMKVRKTP